MGPQLGDGESTDDSDDDTARDDDDDRRSDAEGDDDDNEVAGDDEKDNDELGYLAGHEEDDDDGGSESGGSPTSPDGSRRVGRKRPPSMQDLSIQGLSDAWALATAAEFVNAAAAADPDDDDEHAPATFTAGNTTLLSAAALAMASPAGSPENSVASRSPGGFAAAAATREATAAEDEGAEDERATDAVDDMDDDAADATVPVPGGRKLDDALKKAAKPAFSAPRGWYRVGNTRSYVKPFARQKYNAPKQQLWRSVRFYRGDAILNEISAGDTYVEHPSLVTDWTLVMGVVTWEDKLKFVSATDTSRVYSLGHDQGRRLPADMNDDEHCERVEVACGVVNDVVKPLLGYLEKKVFSRKEPHFLGTTTPPATPEDGADDADGDGDNGGAGSSRRSSKRTNGSSSVSSSPANHQKSKQWRTYESGDRVRLRTPKKDALKRFEKIDLSSFGTMGVVNRGGWGDVTMVNMDGEEVTLKVR